MFHFPTRTAAPSSRSRRSQSQSRVESLERRTLFAVPTVDVRLPVVGARELGPVDGYFTLTRTGGDVSTPLTVRFTVAGTATSGQDYEPIGDRATIPAGATWTNIPVRIIPDTIAEVSENILLRLAAAAGYTLGRGTVASIGIRDDYRSYPEWSEPNEDWREPTPLGDDGLGPRYGGFAVDKGDVDLYRIHSRDDGMPLQVLVEFDHRLGDLNVALLNDVGNRELARSTGTGDVERLTVPTDPGETYLIKVWGEAGATNPRYSADVRPVPAGPAFHVVNPFYMEYTRADFPVAKPGEPSEVTATVMNTGDQPLELGAVAVPAGFTVVKSARPRLAPGEWDTVTFATTGAAAPGVRTADVTFATNQPGGAGTVRLVAATSGVASRQFLYNNSPADNDTPQYGSSDLAAADPAKRGLVPGETASISNVSNYDKGINSVLLKLVRPDNRALSPQDFELRYSGPDGRTWSAAPDSVNVLSVPAENGVSNVSLIWPDYVVGDPLHTGQALANGWLEVTVKANAHTGLDAPDVSYFGNLIGDTGDGPTRFAVNAIDLAGVWRHRAASGADWRYDFNRDGAVDALDLGIARANLNRRLGPAPTPDTIAAPFSATPLAPFARTDLEDLLV